MQDILTVNELFSGIGAFRKALENLGIPYEIVGISEIDKFAIKSYEAIFGKTRNYGDISKCEKLDYADLWTYGFPCQDLSVAGKQRGVIQGQTRSGLLYEVQRLLAVAVANGEQPKYLIMENVKPLVGKKFRPTFESWLAWLDSNGYNTYWKVLNAADYGAPQRRERVFAVSIRKDIDTGFSYPPPVKLKKKFRDLLEKDPDDKFFLSNECYTYLVRHSAECENNGMGFRFSPVEREREQISQRHSQQKLTGWTQIMSQKNCNQVARLVGDKWGSYEQQSRVYDADGLCPTLTAGGGGHHEVKIMERSCVRKLTPREYWRLMGFSDEDFDKAAEVNSNTQLYKQAGNSIVVGVLEAVLSQLL